MTGFAIHLAAFGSSADLTDSMAQAVSVDLQAQSDERLVKLHVDGQPGAIDELIRRHRDELFGYLVRFTGSRALAEDVFQETFLQIHLSAATFDVDRRLKPWLYTIATNKARDARRWLRRRPSVSLDTPVGGSDDPVSMVDLMPSDGEDPQGPLQGAEQSERVRAVVDRLGDTQREVLLLTYFQRMPYAQVADILNIPVGTVKSRLHGAVRAFGELWGEESER
jgi:RNA polymerase sigma-70 factor (ECF subfamily)